jgi:hypothetical protein
MPNDPPALRWIPLGLLRCTLVLALVTPVSCARRESTVAPPVRETSGSTAATTTTTEATPVEVPLPLLNSEQLELEERVDPSEPLPDVPTSPADPTAAAAFAVAVERSAGCYQPPTIDRSLHLAPADCESLFSHLRAGGDPASSAIGEYLAQNAERLHRDVLLRLSLALAANPRPGVLFLVRRLHQLATHDEVAARNGVLLRTTPNEVLVRSRVVSMFELATGYPVEFYAGERTRDEIVAHDRVVATRALRFWHRHGSDPSSWPRLGEQRVRSWLAADESRMVSAARLVRDRPAYGPMVPLVRDTLRRVALHDREAQVILEDLDRLDDSGESSVGVVF